MNLGFQQSQKLTTSLNLTQQMELSIRILQMDNLELDSYVGELAMENPVLELEDPAGETPAVLRQKKLEWLEQQARYDKQNKAYYDPDDTDRAQQLAAPSMLNLPDYLLMQADEIGDKALRCAVKRLVNHIDQNGYLTADEAAIEVCCAGLDTEMVIHRLQEMEPLGVGARSLSECLLLQLPAGAALARQIAADHLELLGKRQYDQLAKLLGVAKDEVLAARNVIRRQDPCPGSAFAADEPPVYILPDLVVEQQDGVFTVRQHDAGRCEVRYNQSAVRMAGETQDPDAKEYLKKKIRQADWVHRCIENRSRTVMLVAQEIVSRQQAFFVHGPGRLEVLSLGDVAGALGLHESTVSRAVRGKYLQCEQGIYPLRYFFVQGIRGGEAGAEGASSEAIRHKIKELIASENPQKPYSDQQIAALLGSGGIDISRRTVAKYRTQMGIEVSGRRGGE